jgi:serine/threonine protein kinase
MRLVRGESLAMLLAREGRMEPRRAAQILLVIAEAVDYAHRLGVLHLDMKPGNVLIDSLGVPLAADFGLARRIDHAIERMRRWVRREPKLAAAVAAVAFALIAGLAATSQQWQRAEASTLAAREIR